MAVIGGVVMVRSERHDIYGKERAAFKAAAPAWRPDNLFQLLVMCEDCKGDEELLGKCAREDRRDIMVGWRAAGSIPLSICTLKVWSCFKFCRFLELSFCQTCRNKHLLCSVSCALLPVLSVGGVLARNPHGWFVVLRAHRWRFWMRTARPRGPWHPRLCCAGACARTATRKSWTSIY